MKSLRYHLPLLVAVMLSGAALLHGSVQQPPDYHNFAAQEIACGVPHFRDVLSNLGFALVAFWGWIQLAPNRRHTAVAYGWAGYRLFLIGLFLTSIGSAYYHLEPDNARLVLDRLPIALACAGLLAAVWGDVQRKDSAPLAGWLAFVAVTSVAWWYFTEQYGVGDLRPYLLLQGLPILLVPLWQWIYDMPRADRLAFGGALTLYVLAKLAELNDREIAALLGGLTGHTLKHVLAAGSAALIVKRLVLRVRLQRSAMVTRSGQK